MYWDLFKFSHAFIFSSSTLNIEITDDSFSASIYTLESSANKIGKRTSETLDQLLTYNMKGSGPIILPCGTPLVTVSVLDLDV